MLENLISTPIWVCQALIWVTIVLEVSALLLDVRHCPKLQFCAISRKTKENLKKWRKTKFRAKFWTPCPLPPPLFLPPIFIREFYEFYDQYLDIVPNYHPMPFKGKLMKEPKFEKIAKILIPARFWPVQLKLGLSKFFSLVLPLLDVKCCRKLSSYSISRKTYDRNSRKWQKTSFWA